ncbi:UNVERIFIED_CONTAM: hypothetical protein HDU68_010074 [Siphonaria sp. JEL0065]|nr:hypothetical protein HDU68_010074 [Siphonaria sp. JEL0065]
MNQEETQDQDHLTTLPPELLVHILAYLRCNQAAKLSQVSRHLHSLIHSTYFCNLLLTQHWPLWNNNLPPSHLLLMDESYDDFDFYFFTDRNKAFSETYARWFSQPLQSISLSFRDGVSNPKWRLTNVKLTQQLARFSNLRILQINNHGIIGAIPGFLGTTLTNLAVVSLSRNNMHGCIPRELGSLIRLTRLDLSFNSFVGRVPDEITWMTSLIYLNLSNNWLEGEVPEGFGARMVHLQDLILARNRFSGIVPNGLVYMGEGGRNDTCAVLDLSENDFSGMLPSWMSGLLELETLDVAGNVNLVMNSQIVDLLQSRGCVVNV